jgi:hypothetical protein
LELFRKLFTTFIAGGSRLCLAVFAPPHIGFWVALALIISRLVVVGMFVYRALAHEPTQKLGQLAAAYGD